MKIINQIRHYEVTSLIFDPSSTPSVQINSRLKKNLGDVFLDFTV